MKFKLTGNMLRSSMFDWRSETHFDSISLLLMTAVLSLSQFCLSTAKTAMLLNFYTATQRINWFSILYTCTFWNLIAAVGLSFAPAQWMESIVWIEEPEIVIRRGQAFVAQEQTTADVLDDADWPNAVRWRGILQFEEKLSLDEVDWCRTASLKTIKTT